MKKEILANQLRKFKYKSYKQMLKHASDDEIIQSFATCDCCDALVVDEEELECAVKSSDSALDFLDLLDSLLDSAEDRINEEMEEEIEDEEEFGFDPEAQE